MILLELFAGISGHFLILRLLSLLVPLGTPSQLCPSFRRACWVSLTAFFISRFLHFFGYLGLYFSSFLVKFRQPFVNLPLLVGPLSLSPLPPCILPSVFCLSFIVFFSTFFHLASFCF